MNRSWPGFSSATAMSLVATTLGTVMVHLARPSGTSLILGVFVLVMGVAATIVSILRANRFAASPGQVSAIPLKAVPQSPTINKPVAAQSSLTSFNRLLESFDEWWKCSADAEELWISFDRWMRDTLHELAGAHRVRAFRTGSGDDQLLSITGELDDPAWARWRGLIDHVIASGHMYSSYHREFNAVIQRLLDAESTSPADSMQPPAWLMPIREGGETIGLVVAGEIDNADWQTREALGAAGHLLDMMWRQVRQNCDLRYARQTDAVTGVLNRADLTLQATRVVNEAAQDGEPVVVLAVAIEGLRRLEDGKHWESQNWLMQQVGRAIRRRLRSDDLIGRFSDDRFVAVLRRIDLPLGELIARKVVASLRDIIQHGDAAIAETVQVRCGLANDPDRHPNGFELLLSRAADALQDARERRIDVASVAGKPDLAGAHA